MATLIDASASVAIDEPRQRTRSGSVEPECNNRTSPSSSFAAAATTTSPAGEAAAAAAKPAEDDLWASLEKESVKRGIKFPSLRGSSSGGGGGGGAGGKWKRRGVHINPADEGMEEWEKVAALVTSSDKANATRPAAGLQWTSDAASSSASSFLTPAASPGRRGSSAEPPSRRRGVGSDDEDDEGGGGDYDEESSDDDDEEVNDDDDCNNSAAGKEKRRRQRGAGGAGGGASISRSDDTTLFREKGSESSGGSGGSARFQRKKEKRECYTRLMELLVKDNLLLLEAICSSVLSHVEDEAEIILPELVRYMLSTQVATDIIVRLIRAEVLGAVDEGTILRGNEPISIMLTAHAKIVGHSFLCQMLKPEIALLCDEINQQKLHLEIDPARMKTKGDVAAAVHENAKNLISVATRFLERIKSCLPLCPSQIRYISSEMRQCLKLRFPSSTVDSVLGGYIFLRLICPIIVSPDSAGMSGEDDGFYLKDGMLQKDTIRISPEAQRGLILLSKTLQQLANGTDFGWKEAFMLPLNSFLHESRPTMNAIFESVATPTTDGKNDDSVALEKGEIHLIKFIFHRLVYIGMDHIEAFVLEREAKRNEKKNESPAAAAAVEGKSESKSEGESDAMKIVDELRHVMRVLGKPPRSLRKYRDIVFYEASAVAHSKSRHDDLDANDEKKMKKSKKSKKMMKKMKRREKKEKKDKKDKSAAVESTKRVRNRSGIARLGRARVVRAESGAGVGGGGGDVSNKWKSDSCSKVSLVLDRNKQRDLKSEAIVRRVRSSDQRADDNVVGGGGGDGDVDSVDTEGGEVVSSSGAESEGGLVEYSSDDDSYSSDFFDDSDDDADLQSSPPPSRHAASSVAEEDIEREREEKIRKKAEIAKKLLEEKYKSYSMRNLRSERAAMKKERQLPLTSREESSKQALGNSGDASDRSGKKRDGRSITLSDLQVVKRERDNEVLRSVGPLSPRGRNLTSPPAQHHQINRHDLSSSSSSESSSEDESPRPPPQTSRTSKLGGRMPSLRIPTREDFKFLSPRRPASGRKEDPKHNN